jgi:hypothetical protein
VGFGNVSWIALTQSVEMCKRDQILWMARLTGNIKSLRVLKNTLEEAKIHDCDNIEGDPTDLDDFPHLKVLDLKNAVVVCYWEA